ncbi:MAG: pentapeptide repeat-containing protein [Microcoleaceae cyanobacterium]
MLVVTKFLRRLRHTPIAHLKVVALLGLSVALLVTNLLISWPVHAENYEKRTLSNSDFSGQDLVGSEFDLANLQGSNFSGADMRGVNLFGAKVQGSNFEGTNLSFATMDKARFNRTNLKNAILEGAFAYNADFSGADIEGADFTDALLRNDMLEKLCAVAKGTNPVTGRDTRETLYCDY